MSVVNAVHWRLRDFLGFVAPTTGFLEAFATIAEAQDFDDVLAPLHSAQNARLTLERFMEESEDVGVPEDAPFGRVTLRAFGLFLVSDLTFYLFSWPAPLESIFAMDGTLDTGNAAVANWLAFMLSDGRDSNGLTLTSMVDSGSFVAVNGVTGLALAGNVLRKSNWSGRWNARQGIVVRI